MMVNSKVTEKHLEEMLKMARVSPQPVYRPCQVQRVLNISATTFGRLCDSYNPQQKKGKAGLHSFFIGEHRRVRHNAIIEMMQHNDNYTIQMEL